MPHSPGAALSKSDLTQDVVFLEAICPSGNNRPSFNMFLGRVSWQKLARVSYIPHGETIQLPPLLESLRGAITTTSANRGKSDIALRRWRLEHFLDKDSQQIVTRYRFPRQSL